MVPRCILVAAFALVYVGYGDACHTGWSSFGTMCYKASIDRENWTGAKTMCEIFGGTLAEIKGADLNAFLLGLAISDDKTAGYWIGMTDSENEDTWQWTTSKDILSAGSYKNWGHNQPDNGQHDQNCVFLNATANGQWYDGHCSNTKKDYLCQMTSGTGGIVG